MLSGVCSGIRGEYSEFSWAEESFVEGIPLYSPRIPQGRQSNIGK